MCLNLIMLPNKRGEGLAVFFLLLGLPHIYGAIRADRKKESVASLKTRAWQFASALFFLLGAAEIAEILSL